MSSADSKARSTAESKAQSEIGEKYSYKVLLEHGCTGYTNYYVNRTANFSNLTTTANLSVVRKLAKYDQVGIDIFHEKLILN